jgi:hypothetical protein
MKPGLPPDFTTGGATFRMNRAVADGGRPDGLF